MRLIDADSMKADLLTVDPQYETMIQWCITVLDAQPTIEPERWISCSEMGPQFPCIAADAHGNPPFIPNGIVCFTSDKYGKWYIDGQYYKDREGLLWENRIVAWMPLPEPYRKEGGE